MTDLAAVKRALAAQRIETPSWAYANSGTRFKVFAQAGVPRNPEEKIADAATVHRFTGVAPTVALHIPWDKVDDYAALSRYAADQGVGIGAINTNVFQDDDYKLGSVTNPDPGIRRMATDHLLEAIDIMDQTGSRDLKLWFSDGINYPGQDDLRTRQDRLAAALRETYDRLGDNQRLLLEYKLFEPAFYATDVPDWAPRTRTASNSANAPPSASTPATTPPAPTSSSSWRSCFARAGWAPSTSTAASTPTTT